ncbi:MAG: DUF1279 domain-containing protein [Myxococcaceae bacterium]
MSATPTPTPPTPGPVPRQKLPIKERLKALMEEYGGVALGTFLVIWVVTLGSLWTAVKLGWQPDSAAGEAGTFGAAYLMFRFTLPLRIGATAVLTPIVAKALERMRLRRPRP